MWRTIAYLEVGLSQTNQIKDLGKKGVFMTSKQVDTYFSKKLIQ